MDTENLRTCLERLDPLQGWFFQDAAVLFAAYSQLVAEQGVRGNTLEIGVYHGKSAVAVASLRAESGTFTAIDVFDGLQARDGSSRDGGLKSAFLANMAASFPTLDWLRPIAAPSSTVRARVLTPVAVGFNKVIFHGPPSPISTSSSPMNSSTSQPTSRRCGDDPWPCSNLRSCRAWISTARHHTGWFLGQSPSC
jgi:hypothetical protein